MKPGEGGGSVEGVGGQGGGVVEQQEEKDLVKEARKVGPCVWMDNNMEGL